jgi:nickel-dependent lactate racemase
VVEGDSVRQARANYLAQEVPQTKGMVVGAGGRGHDETLSHAIRLALGALKGVKKGGEIVLVAECRDGVGSEALQMYLTGRIMESFLKKGSYVDGLEEISYVTDLRERYSVTLLSSLPELYAGGKLKFKTARGSGEALGKVFSAIGRTAKLNVVTRACETVIP